MSLSLHNQSNYTMDLDLTINPWLNELDVHNNIKYLNNLLHIGYIVSKQINIKSNDEDITRLLEKQNQLNKKELELFQQTNDALITKLNNKIDSLGSIINNNTSNTNSSIKQNFDKVHDIVREITGKTNISAHKGQLGENYILNILDTAYPNAQIESTVSESHSADIHFTMNGYKPIYIESKFYSNPVPSSQIEKFKNDLERNNVNLGIFISFKQKITGVYDRIKVEKYGEKTIIYASQLEFNPSDIILPMAFALSLTRVSDSNISNINESILEKLPEIISLTKQLDCIYMESARNIDTIKKHKKNIVDSLDDIYMNTVETYTKMKTIIDEVKTNITSSIKDITGDNSVLFISGKPDFSKYPETIADMYNNIHTLLPEHIQFAECDDSLILTKSKQIYVKFSETKKKIKSKFISEGITMDITSKNIDKFISLL